MGALVFRVFNVLLGLSFSLGGIAFQQLLQQEFHKGTSCSSTKGGQATSWPHLFPLPCFAIFSCFASPLVLLLCSTLPLHCVSLFSCSCVFHYSCVHSCFVALLCFCYSCTSLLLWSLVLCCFYASLLLHVWLFTHVLLFDCVSLLSCPSM